MRSSLLALLLLASTSAAAHGLDHHDSVSPGLNDVLVGFVIAAFQATFAIGWRRMPRRRSGERGVSSWRAGLFVCGVLLLAAVLLPPFDELADRHFSAHMAQHLVLLVIAPPMLAASQAHLVLLQAFPLQFRRSLGRAVSRVPGLRVAAHHSSAIWFVCLSSVAVLWFWHLPLAYDWARRHEAIHDAEHLLFLVTELAFWRVILFRRERELRRAGAALILVAMSVQGGLLAALITLAGRPMYATYGGGSTALADQALGGVMMWVIAGIIYLGVFAILFGQALAQPRRRVRVTREQGGRSELERKDAQFSLVALQVGVRSAERFDLRTVADDDRSAPKVESVIGDCLQHPR